VKYLNGNIEDINDTYNAPMSVVHNSSNVDNTPVMDIVEFETELQMAA